MSLSEYPFFNSPSVISGSWVTSCMPWHHRSVEVGTEPDMVNASDFYGMINMIDNRGVIDFRQFSILHELADH